MAMETGRPNNYGTRSFSKSGMKEGRIPEPLLRLLESCRQILDNSAGIETTTAFLNLDDKMEVTSGFDNEDTTFLPKTSFTNDFAKAFRLKEMLKKDPFWVQWLIKIDGKEAKLPALKIVFKYLPNLNIVVTESCILTPPNNTYLNNLSDLLLRSEHILHYLRKDDHGFENPNPNSQHLLKKARVNSFSELALFVGFPYKWAQEICDLKFDLNKEVLAVKEEDQHEYQRLRSYKTFQKTIQLILARFKSWLETWDESRATERRILTAKDVKIKPWRSVNPKELQRLLSVGENLTPTEFSQAPKRIFMKAYCKNNYEVRVGAILERHFPIQLPVLKLKIKDKTGSVPKFFETSIVENLQQDLNLDRFTNVDTSQLAQLLQITKLMFYVDELLQPQTYTKVSKPSLRIRIPKKTGIVFGTKNSIETVITPSDVRGRKKPEVLTSICLGSGIHKKNWPVDLNIASKTKPEILTANLNEGFQIAIQSKRVSERTKFKPSILKRKVIPHLEDESAIMDVNDIASSNNFTFHNKSNTSDPVEQVPWIPKIELESGGPCRLDKSEPFKFVMPLENGKPRGSKVTILNEMEPTF